MKKNLLFICVFLFAMNVNAQIALEHTFNFVPTYIGSNWRTIPACINQSYYMECDYGNHFKLYDSDDYSLLGDYNIILENSYELAGGVSSIIFLPVGLYKNDGESYYIIEISSREKYGTNQYNKSGIYKLVGNNIVLEQEILSCQSMTGGYLRYNGNKVIYHITENDFSAGTFSYHIYTFGGTFNNISNVESSEDNMTPYPNPSQDIIHLTYNNTGKATSLRIYDVNGKLMEKSPVDSNTSEYVLDVSGYPKGVYFYEIEGKAKSFIVK